MADLCRACTIETFGAKAAPWGKADFVAKRDEVEVDGYFWGVCDECGLHLFNDYGNKACKTGAGSSPLAVGDLQLGCERCHKFQRRRMAGHEALLNRKPWESWEDAALRRLVHEGKSNPEIAKALCRTDSAIQTRLYILGVVRRTRQDYIQIFDPWTAEEDERLVAMATREKLTYREMGKRLGRTKHSVANRLDFLGFRKLRGKTLLHARMYTPWSPAEDEMAIEMATNGKLNNIQIGAALGRTPDSVNRRFSKIGNPRGADNCLYCDEALDHEGRRGKKRKYCDREHERLYWFEQRQAAREAKEKKQPVPVKAAPSRPGRSTAIGKAAVIRLRCEVCTRPATGRYCDDICQKTAVRARALAASRRRKQRQQEEAAAKVEAHAG